MAEYLMTPHATAAPFEPTVVALAANTTKTVLQVATPAAIDLRIVGWGISFDGASGTAVPVISHLLQTDVAATGLTPQSPDNWGNDLQPNSLCVSGAAATGHGGGVTPTEGTITVVRYFDSQHVHPQAGYGVYWPDGHLQPKVPVSRFLRIRCRAQAAVNVIPWVIWAEPSI
jgi:hypothetical protein